MPNIGQVLKAEIARLAKKEAKSFSSPVSDSVTKMRKELSAQKKKIADLEKKIQSLTKKAGLEDKLSVPNAEEMGNVRLRTDSLAKLRAKLGLSRAAMAKVLDVNPNSVFLWEKGKTSPRTKAKAKIISLRSMGKREIKKLLKDTGAAPKGKSKYTKRARKPAVTKAKKTAPTASTSAATATK